MDKDQVFNKEMEFIPDFTFGNGVVAVFDDMRFRYCDVFFKWYNFCGMVAIK